ncbi:MAG: hypothetical protein JWP30_899 [Homoserinimonas sp.]|nr:hypothetical protein [Homoserinimonas sp.]
MPVDKLSLTSVIPVWVAAALGAVLILVFVPSGQQLLWMPVTLAAATLVTFCIQLGVARKEGLVNRVMASMGGCVAILAIATAISAVAALA